MKEIIYLNEDFINSFISQVYNGLPIQKESEETSSSGEKGTDLDSETSTGKAKAGLALFGGEYNYKTSEQNSLTTFESEETKEIISKKIHDNALNDLEKILTEKERLKYNLSDIQFGDYVKLRIQLKITDLITLKEVFSEKTFETVKKAMDNENMEKFSILEDALNQIPSNEKAQKNKLNKELKQLKSKANIEIADAKKGFDLGNIFIGFIIDFMPTSLFMKTQDAVIPLKEKYLRNDIKTINFNYANNELDGEVTLIGKVTKKIASTDILDGSTIKSKDFYSMYVQLNNAFSEYFKILDILNIGEYVIDPISVFFEDDLI